MGQETSIADQHADKYHDPRVQITRRGVWMGVGVFVLAIATTAASIYFRRTQLGRTTDFFGENTITALQLAEKVELVVPEGAETRVVDLTRTPGLGHLRRALLDERHYEWSTVKREPVQELEGQASSQFVELVLSDPTAQRFNETHIGIELNTGWVGLANAEQMVQLNDRAKPAIKHTLKMWSNYKPERLDNRE